MLRHDEAFDPTVSAAVGAVEAQQRCINTNKRWTRTNSTKPAPSATSSARRLLRLFVWSRLAWTSNAFASYMTSGAGCLTDLDTTEVIMNHPVVASPSWADKARDGLSLVVTPSASDTTALPTARPGSSSLAKNVTADRAVIQVPQVPYTVWVKVEGTAPDAAQYVLQVGGGDGGEADSTDVAASLEGGQCADATRYTGIVRRDEGVALTIHRDGAQLWAGWAAGHEAVQLLPGYIFRVAAAQKAYHDPQKALEEGIFPKRDLLHQLKDHHERKADMLDQNQKQKHVDQHYGGLAAHVKTNVEEQGEANKEDLSGEMEERRARQELARKHSDRLLHRPGAHVPQDMPRVTWDVHYLGALLFFVGSMVVSIQICRFASARGSSTKGRLDM
jgi:hypothetical protein